ncbi:heptosyltransferase-2 [Desulfocicer vacuolatum DSM 3385]|uniref:lipopolysaccharide heptosyltransferase II n=1 Tax=Desulfocicer vacuolatum DSM 3385 TaxID=1121400 RepID=A0A1W1Z8N8_9BACT|nr:lipopolysaccharide heptosyltransferase II [Desulfocicer vacuolatum]SMC44773.1 heptosyltransferase-2 [Desulfocicer vacuolatum DSM 3385]
MKILLVQLSYLGDMILSTPVISGLKKIYPKATLTVMTTPLAAPLVENDPLVHDIIVFDKRGSEKNLSGILKKANQLRQAGFDRVYSLHRSPRTAILLFVAGIPVRTGFKDAKLHFLYTDQRQKKIEGHSAIRNLSLLFNELPEAELNQELRLFAPRQEHLLKKAKINFPSADDFIIMAPGSAWKTKQWHWQGYSSVGHYFAQQGKTIVLVGGPADTSVCAKINDQGDFLDLSGKISLSNTLYLMEKTKLLICNDSMALHMASAFKIPTVAVFCATSPEFGFGPWQNPDAMVVEDATLECKPCRRHGSNQCPNGTEACMKISARQVIDACKKVLT